jgi:hypothetical protein
MKLLLCSLFFASMALSQEVKPSTGANSSVESLLDVRRLYVGDLVGGLQASALRELIIASLNSTKLFILTDNEARADAVLKGAADDKEFTDTFDTYEAQTGRDSLGKTGSALTTKLGSMTGASSMGETESHHNKEHKHEAYATVRLCNKDGDVLWSTTQESLGAKFRGASADVAAKIAHQISLDYERARKTEEPDVTPASAPTAPKK